jgi:hypothetical protein
MESEDDVYIQVEDQGGGDAKSSNAAAKSTRMSLFFLAISSKKVNNGPNYSLNSQRICQDGSTSFSGISLPSFTGQRYAIPDIFLVDGGRNCTY